MRNPKAKDNQRALLVKKIAEKHGLTPRFVYQVLSGDRENEKVLADYMELKEQVTDLFKNALLDEVNRLVPFN